MVVFNRQQPRRCTDALLQNTHGRGWAPSILGCSIKLEAASRPMTYLGLGWPRELWQPRSGMPGPRSSTSEHSSSLASPRLGTFTGAGHVACCFRRQGIAGLTNWTDASGFTAAGEHASRWWRPAASGAHERSQAFLVRPGLDGSPDTISLELAGAPGVWLTAFVWPDAHEGCSRWARNTFCALEPARGEPLQPKPTPGAQ